MNTFLKIFLFFTIALSTIFLNNRATIVSFHETLPSNLTIVLLGTEHWKDDQQSILQAGILLNAFQQFSPHDHILLEDNPAYRIKPLTLKKTPAVKNFHSFFPHYAFSHPNLQENLLDVCNAYKLCCLSKIDKSLSQVIKEKVLTGFAKQASRNTVCPLELFLNMFEENKFEPSAQVESIDNRIVYSHLNKILILIDGSLMETTDHIKNQILWCSNDNNYTFNDLCKEWAIFLGIKVKKLREIAQNKPDFIEQLNSIETKSSDAFSIAMNFLMNSFKLSRNELLNTPIKTFFLSFHKFFQKNYTLYSSKNQEIATRFFEDWQRCLTEINNQFSDAFVNLFDIDVLLRILEIEYSNKQSTKIIVLGGDEHIKSLKILLDYFGHVFDGDTSDKDNSIEEVESSQEFEYLHELIASIAQ